eukprot:3545107-Heterocapsa_arctica.AAC.1
MACQLRGVLFTAVLSLNCWQLPNAPPGVPCAALRYVGDASAACTACCRLRDLSPLRGLLARR